MDTGTSPCLLQVYNSIAVFNDVSVFGDINLESPSFLSNRSAVEIHLNADPNMSVKPIDIIVELPLHARYQVSKRYHDLKLAELPL